MTEAAKSPRELTAKPILSLAACENYKTNPIQLTENSPPGHRTSTARRHPAPPLANSNTAIGIAARLYDSSRRSRCTGKERDLDSDGFPTSFDYFGRRYFSGAEGRFTSPDPFIPFNLKKEKFEAWRQRTPRPGPSPAANSRYSKVSPEAPE